MEDSKQWNDSRRFPFRKIAQIEMQRQEKSWGAGSHNVPSAMISALAFTLR